VTPDRTHILSVLSLTMTEGSGIVATEGWKTGDQFKKFLEKNPKLERMKKARDSKGGIFKWLDIAIFCYLLLAPVLGFLPGMSQPAYALILLAFVIAIAFCKIEYNHRAEVWHMCLYRGVIVDFPKTNTAAGWLLKIPTVLAISFLMVYGFVLYIGLDPDFKFPLEGETGRKGSDFLLTAILAILGVLFVLLMTKAFVDVEGAPQLQTLNLTVWLFEDPELLKEKGFTVVHFSQLESFVDEIKKSGNQFSWQDVHALSHEVKPGKGSINGGITIQGFLKKFKDSDECPKQSGAV